MVNVRHYRAGEFLPAPLTDTAMPKLDAAWTWVVTPATVDLPFAIVVCSYASGWLVVWRLIALKPLPNLVSPHWFLEAFPKVLENARESGCVGLLSLLADDKETEVRLARLMCKMGGELVPFKGSLGVMPLVAKG